jgi:hypothetical protein
VVLVGRCFLCTSGDQLRVEMGRVGLEVKGAHCIFRHKVMMMMMLMLYSERHIEVASEWVGLPGCRQR